jgi:hypothetical protein
MNLDITEKLDKDIKLIDETLRLANTSGVLITMDSNSKSRTWHDELTNGRSKKPEEFVISKLIIKDEENELKTFQSSRGSSNIHLTISNNKLLKTFRSGKSVKKKFAQITK